ncbi:hypothetical protein LTR37_011010 [Vermiconidia calcicola]|uniref:Uncharacterized protein n=1 Tax=Vermiconidia calcicola TaxID=1690605 RepID=A0ACC3N3B2_9PEZI|nr:hypothetical protein LTR37_011010 [Vermiconidia calcicola]
MSYGNSSGTSYGGGGLGDILSDLSGIESHADNHSGTSGDRSLFSSALGMLQQRQGELQNEDVDEDHMVNSHQSYFGGGGTGGEATSGGMGAAAAMQALKMFNQGGSGSSGSSGSGNQQEYIGMAMGQAAKLFEQQQASGNVASGESKESAVQKAGEMALKMYMKSEMSGGSSESGSGSSGGGLMGLAQKFMK